MAGTKSKTQIREAKNRVFIEGILSEKDLNEITYEKNNKEIEAVSGRIFIEVADNEVHRVDVFANRYTKNGRESRAYTYLTEEAKAIADDGVGRENADKVTVLRGQLSINDYKGRDGALRSYPQISTFGIHKRTETDEAKHPYKPRATFDIEGFIQSIKEEEKNEEPTGRLLVKLIVPQYDGTVSPLDFVVNKDIADGFHSFYSEGDTAEFEGNIINHVEVIERTREGGFGKPKKETTYNTQRELVIVSGSDPYEEDTELWYDPEVIKKALAVREVDLEKIKNGNDDKQSSSKSKSESKSKGGFNRGARKPIDDYDEDYDDDSLPF